MNTPELHHLGPLSRVVIIAAIMLCVGGIAWHGLNPDVFRRLSRQLLDRPSGPMSFRFFLQPSMAAIAAIHDGMADTRHLRTPYFRTFIRSSRKRAALLREGVSATARILLLGLVMDLVYQLLVFDTFYPGEAVAIALMLGFLPYVIIRGPVLRVLRWRQKRRQGELH